MTYDSDSSNLIQSREPDRIAGMFNRIARSYDLMNRIMTFGQDGRWRKAAADEAMLLRGEHALDVATGTGDMARELALRVGPGGSVLGLDIAADMLTVARGKTQGLPVTYEQGDISEFEDPGRFDAATVAFGFRNFADREAGLRAMAEALKPRGRLVVLELVPPQGRLKPLADFYEHRIIPRVGGLISRDSEAYRYLPESVAVTATTAEIERLMQRIGLTGIRSREFNFGTVAIVRGVQPA